MRYWLTHRRLGTGPGNMPCGCPACGRETDFTSLTLGFLPSDKEMTMGFMFK